MTTLLRTALQLVLLWFTTSGWPPTSTAPSTYHPKVDQTADRATFTIIPRPASITPQAGSFEITSSTRIVITGSATEELYALGRAAAVMVRQATGIDLAVSAQSPADDGADTIVLQLSSDEEEPRGFEGYQLEVKPRSIVITGEAPAGLFYGLQTLRQLLPHWPDASGSARRSIVPAVRIEDAPRFEYRGMHLDVGRHFFPVPFIKRYLDLIAMYKMNTFHWHLTEDQGWRMEIKRYPRLTEVGGVRKETILEKNFDPYVGDGIPHGGSYTQDEIREIVAYARRRYITVIPEIEMPGHSTAALAAYPELACTEGPFEVSTRWGVHEDVYCPSEETFAFLQNVLTEVMDLFPSRYIHIGGDEVSKTRWKESPVAQEVMRREGLSDEDQLQSYFIRRIERFLLAHGRRLIGWDEILEGGLAPEATVMSWRGMEGGVEAAKQGHDVIMTPNSHVYFDYYQGDRENEPLAIGGFIPLEKVYSFEPVPAELNSDEASHVLGAQGNVWTEYMPTTDHVEYMVLPRLIALSEVVWSPREARNWDSFMRRLPPHFARLGALGVKYRQVDR